MQAAPIGLGQALAAEFGRMLQALPAALGELAEGLLEAGRGRDLAVAASDDGLRVAFARSAARPRSSLNLRALLEHGLRRVEAGLLEAGQLRDLRRCRPARSCTNSMSLTGARVAHGSVSGMRCEEGASRACPLVEAIESCVGSERLDQFAAPP